MDKPDDPTYADDVWAYLNEKDYEVKGWSRSLTYYGGRYPFPKLLRHR